MQQRHAEMFEGLRKAEHIRTHLVALEQLANSSRRITACGC